MIRNVIAGAVLAGAAILPQLAHAAINDADTGGFSVTEAVHIAAPPAAVFAKLVKPSLWWSSEHTFSHDAKNLTLDPRAGGCWCETLANGGGSVLHLMVVAVKPNEALVMRGALGPLQALGVDGSLTIELTAKDGGTDLKATYNVGGYLKGGLASWAGPVDRVLGEQFNSLKAALEGGKPKE